MTAKDKMFDILDKINGKSVKEINWKCHSNYAKKKT